MLLLKKMIPQKLLIPIICYLSITLIGVLFLFSCKNAQGTSNPKPKSSGQAALLKLSANVPWFIDNSNGTNTKTTTITNYGPGSAILGSTTGLFPTDIASIDGTNSCTSGLHLANGDSCNLVIDSTNGCYSNSPPPSECGAGPVQGGQHTTGTFSFSYTDGVGTKTVLSADGSSPTAYVCNCDD